MDPSNPQHAGMMAGEDDRRREAARARRRNLLLLLDGGASCAPDSAGTDTVREGSAGD
jgi:hypothetical protein